MTDDPISNGDDSEGATLPLPDPENRQVRAYRVTGEARDVSGPFRFAFRGRSVTRSSAVIGTPGRFDFKLCGDDGAEVYVRGGPVTLYDLDIRETC